MKKTIIALAALAATSAPAMASSFDRSAQHTGIDSTLSIGLVENGAMEGIAASNGYNLDVTGYKLGVDFKLDSNFFLAGHYADLKHDVKTYGGELGYKFDYSDKVDLISSIGTYNIKVSDYKFDDAFVVKAGFDSEISPGLNFQLGLKHYKWDAMELDDTNLYFGAQVQLTQGMSVGLMHDRHLEETSLNFAFNF